MDDVAIQQLIGRGVQLYVAGELGQAEDLLRQVLQRQPGQGDALHMLGVIAHRLGRGEEALELLGRAVAAAPRIAEFHNSLGNVRRALGRYENAVAAYRNALALKPDLVETHYNLGCALASLRRLDEAMAAYERAIALRPDFAAAHWNLALTLLLRGKIVRGWEEHEWRFAAKKSAARRFNRPRWDGSDLKGRAILLDCEQGLGDAIQFVRFAPLVAERGGRVVLGCPSSLRRLFAGADGVERVAGSSKEAGEFDVYCPMMSLPLVLGTTPQTIPAHVPYLQADPALAACWRQRVAGADARLRVGLAWAGNPIHEDDRSRSMAAALLAPLGAVEGVSFYSLQKGDRAAQAVELMHVMDLIDWTGELNDFAETAALIENLDLVITVDTAVAHLAGAMGKRVWLMLPWAPDWRWMLDREDSLWYPTMRLFRQSRRGQWRDVVERVTRELKGLADRDVND
jgi:Flp pilus assembly protein TadD